MKRTFSLKALLLALLLIVSYSVHGTTIHEWLNYGTITVYVDQESTVYHPFPTGVYVNPSGGGWYLRQTTGNSWVDSQETGGAKIVSKDYSSCTIKGLWDNTHFSDGPLTSKLELYCKGTKQSQNEEYVCSWTIIVKSRGTVTVSASPSGGTVSEGTKVYLTPSISGADIYYSTNGSIPNKDYSPKYTSEGITINETTTLKAIAYKSGYDNEIGTLNYIVPAPVTGLTLNSHLLTLKPSATYQLRATIKPNNANDKSVTWSSLDTNIADVSSSGLVTAKKLGATKVICKSNDNSSIQDTCIVLCSNLSYGQFTAPTAEGVELTYYVDSSTGNCGVWNGNNTAIAKDYNGKVTIPNEVYGLKVTQIGNYAFRDCAGITGVVIPSNVTRIGTCAFLGCTSLTNITGMDNVEGIGNYAFSSSLFSSQGIPWYNSLPDGLVYIGKVLYSYKGTMPNNTEISVKDGTLSICSNALSSSNLVAVSIPKTVRELGGNPFRGSSGLKRIVVASGNAVYDSRNSCNAIIETATNKLVAGCTGTVIPSTVKIISSSAFNGSVPEELVIPNGVDSIPSQAISGKALKRLIVGTGLRKIGGQAFIGTSITSISVASGNPYFDSRNNCNAIIEKSTNTLVVGCPTTIIPSTVKTIGSFSFDVNTDGFNGVRIVIPESVETIGRAAFQSCNIGSVVIGSNVSVIEEDAFYACGNLAAIYALSRNPSDIDEEAFAYQPNNDKIYNSTTLIVPVGTIANYRSKTGWNRFSKIIEGDVNTMVEGMTINKEPLVFRVTSTENKTCELYGTTGTVTGSLSIPSQVDGYTVTNVASYALRNQEITSLTLPATVVSMQRNPFYGCNNLASITVDAGNPMYDSRNNCNAIIEKATNKLIAGCKNTVIPNGIKHIGIHAFFRTSSLSAIGIPSTVEIIDSLAFAYTGISEISIPSSVKKIEYRAFRCCDNLNVVTSMIEQPFAISYNVFECVDAETNEGYFSKAKLRVPYGTRALYAATDGWKNFQEIEEQEQQEPEPDTPTDISQYSNIVYLESASSSPESTITLPVKMKNAQTNISGFQFDLMLPTGVTVEKDEDGFYLIELSTDRTTARKHTVSAQQQTDGSIRVVCYSNNNSTFSGTDGNVLTMTLLVAADAPTGETSIKLRDVVMTTPALDSYNVPWVVSKLTIEDYIPGDVNGDKLVNVVDVAGVVNLILNSGNTAQLNRKAADINGDNNINVVDVAGVVNIILGGGANARMSAPRTAAGQSRIYIEDFSLEPGEEKTVSVNLSNPGDSFTGCQFDLYLPEGLTVAEEDGFPLIEIGSRTTARKHTVSATAQADGSLRVVCYSNNNYTFSGEDGEILTITFKAAGNAPSGKKTVWMRNITLSRPDVTGVSPDDTSAEVTIAGNTPQKLVLTASPSSGVVPRGTVVTISANVEGATIIYWVNDDPLTSALSPLVLTINENTEISAGAIKEGYENSDELRLYYTISDNSGINDITSEGKSNSVFSLSGQRLTVPRRGVNIVSGRKVVVR
ncbi:MAG: leucine-rich repeat protein [Prevotella sp.]|nr:leucine-rich repeat protein [Prevotella sp.]